MKKHLLLLIMMLLPIVASADDSGSCGDNVTYTYIESTKTLIISGTGDMYHLNPSYTPWNSYKTSIQTLIIESGVTSIGNNAFDGCDGVTSITIPNSVTYIGGHAFDSCSGLTSVTIPNSVTSIGDCAFLGCYRLESISVEKENSKYDSRNNCNAIIETTNNILILGCKNTIIPNDITSIGYAAFAGCSGLTSVTIPNSVISIGDFSFYGCCGLTLVTIPNSVTSIGDYSFWDCSGLTSVTIPNSVTLIGSDAFRGCSGLTSVTIPNNVTTISNYTFSGCSGLTSVTIPNSVISIGNYAFLDCSGLTSVEIPNSVTSIGFSAFSGCSGLTSVTIPNSVISIGNYAFLDCSGLTSVEIPNSVTSIGFSAFSGCSGLTSVTIPNSVISISNYTFNECSSLTSVIIPNSVISIDRYAFSGCSGLTSVTIPNSVTSIGESTFASCVNLKTVQCFAEDVPSTSSTAFEASNPQDATLYVPAASVYAYKTTVPWSYFGIIKAIESTQKCATPAIFYGSKKLLFNCETEGVEYVYEIKDTDVKKGNDSEVQLSATYEISVYATKQGYENSDIATATLVWGSATFTETTGQATAAPAIKAESPLLIQSQGGLLTIQGADDGTKIGVYNINGTLACEGISHNGCATVNTNLQPGSMAIIKIGDRSVKVVVK